MPPIYELQNIYFVKVYHNIEFFARILTALKLLYHGYP